MHHGDRDKNPANVLKSEDFRGTADIVRLHDVMAGAH